MTVTVRYFAAARRAAGTDEETREVSDGTTLGAFVAELSGRNTQLAQVLGKCQFLVNERAAVDFSVPLRDGALVDVLPPFAGG